MTPQHPSRASEVALRAAFRDWFGVTSGEADVLTVLYQAAGVTRPASMIATLAGIRESSVDVLINRLRQALDAEALDHHRGAGYSLTPEGMDECRGAIRQFTQALGRVA